MDILLTLLAVAVILGLFALVGLMIWRTLQPFFEHSIFYEIYDMCLRVFTDSDSATDRMDAIRTNLRFITGNPLTGDVIAEVLHGTNHNTSSTLLLYAILGVVGGTLHVAGWIALVWKRERNVLGNLIWFVPLGFFLRWLYSRLTWKGCLWLAAALSTGIELFQWLLQSGISDIDDIIFNTIGALLGWYCYSAAQRIWKYGRKKI